MKILQTSYFKKILTSLATSIIIAGSLISANFHLNNNHQGPKENLINQIYNHHVNSKNLSADTISNPDYGKWEPYELSNTILNLLSNIESYFDYNNLKFLGTTDKEIEDNKASFLALLPNVKDPNFDFNKFMTESPAGSTSTNNGFLTYITNSLANLFPSKTDASGKPFKPSYSPDGELQITTDPTVDFKVIFNAFLNWIASTDNPYTNGSFAPLNLNFLYENPSGEFVGIPNISQKIGLPVWKLLFDITNLITNTKNISGAQIENMFAFTVNSKDPNFKLSGQNDFMDIFVFHWFVSIQRDFEYNTSNSSPYPNHENPVWMFNEKVLMNYLNYDAYYGNVDKKDPSVEKEFGIFKHLTDYKGINWKIYTDHQLGWRNITNDFGMYIKNILSNQPSKKNTTIWGTLFTIDKKDHSSPSDVQAAISKFNADINTVDFNSGLNDLSFVDISKYPEKMGITQATDNIVNGFDNNDSKNPFKSTSIYTNIINSAEQYNGIVPFTDSKIAYVKMPPQVFIVNHDFIIWIFVPFIIISMLGVIFYYILILKWYMPLKTSTHKAKKVIHETKKIRANKKKDSQDNY